MIRPDPDSGLVEDVGRDDAGAVRRLVAAKLPRVLALATRMLGDRGDAEDVAQEAFVRVWRNAARWQPGRARFDTWLHQVVVNLCRDRLRRRRPGGGDMLAELADPAPTADTALIAAERAATTRRAIAALPPRQREAILLVHYQELAGAEAAAVLGVSAEALESLLARGRRRLRDVLAEAADD